jgi:hypothetical protein
MVRLWEKVNAYKIVERSLGNHQLSQGIYFANGRLMKLAFYRCGQYSSSPNKTPWP